MTGRYQVAGGANDECRSNAPNKGVAFEPRNDRNDALLDQKIRWPEGREPSVSVADQGPVGKHFHFTLERKEIRVTAGSGFEDQTLHGVNQPLTVWVFGPKEFQNPQVLVAVHRDQAVLERR